MTTERPFDRAGPVLLGALAPFTFLLVDPAGWYPFGPVKWAAVSVLGLGGVAVVFATRRLVVPRSLAVAMVGWLGWLAVAAAVGLDPTFGWVGTPERHLGVVTWVLCALLLLAGASLRRPAGPGDPGPERVAPVLIGLIVAGLGVGGVATVEALGWEPDVLDVGSRLTATFGSAAYLGAATALLLPICVGVAADPGVPRHLRLGAAAASPLLLVACVGSGARAAWFGLVVATVVTAWAQRAWLAARRSVVLRIGAVLAAAAIAIVLLTPAGARLTSLTDEDAPGGQGRLDEWRVAARVVGDHLLTGVGPEGYRIAFAGGVDADYERSHGREQQPDRAHAGPLDMALTAGIPGLAAWLAVIVLVGRRVLRAVGGRSAWLVGLGGGLLAHWAGQLLLFPLAELEPIAWLLAGVIVVWVEPVPEVPQKRGASRTGSRGLALVAATAAGIAALAALVAGVTDLRADRRADDAADASARGDHAAAARAAVDAAEQRPDIVRLHVLAAAARVADQQGTLPGIEQLERALDISPGDPIVLLARVRLLVDRAGATHVPQHVDVARDELDRLLAADRHNAALWRERARLALVEGDEDRARDAADRAASLTPPDQRR